MKRIISLALCLIIIISLILSAAPAVANAADADNIYRVTKKTDIQTGPSSGYKELGSLDVGDTFISLGTVSGSHGYWHKMSYEGKTGYVRGAYTEKASSTTQPSVPSEPKPTEPTPSNPPASNTPVVSNNLYRAIADTDIQTGPSSGYKEIGVLKKGETFVSTGTASGKNGIWYKFDYNGKTGYVRGTKVEKVTGTVQPSTPAPAPTNPPAEEPTPNTPIPENMYQAKKDTDIQTGPSSGYAEIGVLKKGETFISIGTASGKNGIWYKFNYNGRVGYVRGSDVEKATTATPNPPVVTPEPEIQDSSYPMTYKDDTCTITIYKEWHENAYVYAAHIVFSDYDRLWAECAKGKYNSGTETTSAAAKRVGAILAINGDYATPGNGASGYAIARKGVVCNDKKAYPEGVYNSNTGLLLYGQSKGIGGQQLSTLVAEGKVTDTFQFGPCFLIGGTIYGDPASTSRAQRTFIGTNGNPGDIWLCVSDGRYNDGKSAGLNAYQCATYLKNKGCTLGVPLDGGGSSTMYFNGKVLNAAKGGQRSVADFVMFK